MNNFNKALLLVAASVSLAGCQLFTGGKSHMAHLKGDASRSLATLEEGRTFLRDGQIAAALASFKIAQLDVATRADATNGLAVAYAKLGRPDLARRYFMLALSLDPGNTVYAANLLRLQRNTALAEREEAAPAAEPQTESEAPQKLAEAEPARLEKVARGVVYLHLENTQDAAPHMTVMAANEEAAKTVAVAANDAPSSSKTVYLNALQ